MTETSRTPQETAEDVRDGMFANDNASKGLGMRIVEVGPGQATLEMRVRADMLNGHAICHGGFISRWPTPPSPSPATRTTSSPWPRALPSTSSHRAEG
jgi:hypothetical protein